MNDLISRSTLRDEILSFLQTEGLDEWDVMQEIERRIETAPTIDAVPVVRCKECVCCTIWDDRLICSRIRGIADDYYVGSADVVKPEDYCSFGIRQRAMPLDAKTDGA